MKNTSWIIAAAAAGILSLGVSGASAAPLGSSLAGVKSASQDASSVEQVRTVCTWHRGYRHCRWVAPVYSYYYTPRYYAPRPYFSFYSGPRHRRWY